jgi:hypothetical protein
MRRLAALLAALNAYLGHGRALESALAFVKLQYALMIAASPWPVFMLAINDVNLPKLVLALPFFLAGGTSFLGLALNHAGYPCSRFFRIAGAAMGMSVWVYILTKNILIGWIAAGVNPWCLMGIIASVWIIRRGALGLPPPGMPGQT